MEEQEEMKETLRARKIAEILSEVASDETAVIFGPCTCGRDNCEHFSVVLVNHDKMPYRDMELACALIPKEKIPWFIASLFEIYMRWDEAQKAEQKAAEQKAMVN